MLGWMLGLGAIQPQGYAAVGGLPGASVSTIAAGWRGTEQTIAQMARLAAEGGADPRVRMAAERIVGRDLPARQYEAECARLLNFVRQHVRYTLDPRGVEQIKRPRYLLFDDRTRLGDCDDSSTLFAALAMSIGHEAGFRALKADPARPNDYSHVYAVCRPRAGGPWLAADATESRCRLGDPPERYHRTWAGVVWSINPQTGGIRRDNGLLAQSAEQGRAGGARVIL